MDKLKYIMSLCEHSVSVTVNDHRDYYLTVEEHLNNYQERVEEAVLKEMIKTNTVVSVQAFPRSASSSVLVYHHDLDKALDEVIKQLT